MEKPIGEPLIHFAPRVGSCTNLDWHPYMYDPKYIDLDLACFMMLTKDLPTLFGMIGLPTNKMVKVEDLEAQV